jgi:hypothetical protein
MHLLLHFSLGVILSIILSIIWTKRLREELDIIVEIEHYHWGLVSLIIGVLLSDIHSDIHYFFFGLGLMLIIDESLQKHPFAYGSKHFLVSSMIGFVLFISLGIFLLIL